MSNTPLPSSFNPAGIELDRRQGLSRQLYQALRVRVLDGRLASGTRLPASRDSFNDLGPQQCEAQYASCIAVVDTLSRPP